MTVMPLPFPGRNPSRLERNIVTPEGVLIPVRLATLDQRLIAFTIDIVIVLGCVIVVMLLGGLAFIGQRSYIAFSLALLASFFIRSFYFALLEIAWRGKTVGKRVVGLRVIDRRGGPLRPGAIFARNLMREVEIFLPLSLMLMGYGSEDERWQLVAMLVWMGVLVLLPAFNRERLRAGDMVAGTWVIAVPKMSLLADLTVEPAPQAAAAESVYRFTDKQLRVYGVYELQVLEHVLRDTGPQAADARRAVAESISRKVGYEPPPGAPLDARAFLTAFYRAQRARLETELAFGRRRESKRDDAPRR
jgi:uncharacterized RDD family membrane protein YckC